MDKTSTAWFRGGSFTVVQAAQILGRPIAINGRRGGPGQSEAFVATDPPPFTCPPGANISTTLTVINYTWVSYNDEQHGPAYIVTHVYDRHLSPADDGQILVRMIHTQLNALCPDDSNRTVRMLWSDKDCGAFAVGAGGFTDSAELDWANAAGWRSWSSRRFAAVA